MIQQKKAITFISMITLFLPTQAALQRVVQTAKTNPGLAAAGAAALGLLFEHQSIDQVRARVDTLEKQVRGTEGDGKDRPYSLSQQVTQVNGILHGDDQTMTPGLVQQVRELTTTVGKKPARFRQAAWDLLDELEKRPTCTATHSTLAVAHFCQCDEKKVVSRTDLEALNIGKPSRSDGSTLWQRMEAFDAMQQLAKTAPELPAAAPVSAPCGYNSAAFEGLQRKVRTIETTLGESTLSDGRSIWDHVVTLKRAHESGPARADGQHESKQMVTQKEFSERVGPMEDAIAGLQQRVTTEYIDTLVAQSIERSGGAARAQAQATGQDAEIERTRQTRALIIKTVEEQVTIATKKECATKDELKGYIKATTLPALVKKTELNLLLQKATAFQSLLERVAQLEAKTSGSDAAAERKVKGDKHDSLTAAEAPSDSEAAAALAKLATDSVAPTSNGHKADAEQPA